MNSTARSTESSDALSTQIPLAVDLDGTLLCNDSLLECLCVLLRRHPVALFQLPFWLLRGRAYLKQRMAARAELDTGTLPLRTELLALLRGQQHGGRRLLLVSGADEHIAQAVADDLQLFNTVIASNGQINLTAERKRNRLLDEFGLRGFDYVGNSWHDLPVWAAARQAWVVSPSKALAEAAARVCTVDQHLPPHRPTLATYLSAIRLSHWPKSLLLFVPLLLAHRLHEVAPLLTALRAALCFSLVASSVYLLNDLLDLESDRHHPQKKRRALASGRLPIGQALLLIPSLWLLAAVLGHALPAGLGVLLLGYLALMLAYCLRLKDLPIVDALVLAAGYTLRIVAGALVLEIAVPAGLFVSAAALFFGLALMKRYAELISLAAVLGSSARARTYRPSDAVVIAELGIASCCTAVILLASVALYPAGLQQGYRVWPIGGVCALLMLWIGHMWLMAHQGRIPDDPVAFASRDWVSRLLAGLMMAALLVESWLDAP